jgi:hypothetical protein
VVAVDLSVSGVRSLPDRAFFRCIQLAAVAFPPELESIGEQCFFCCGALRVVDLAGTQLLVLAKFAFAWSGVARVTVPASLRAMGAYAFCDTLLKVLDLSACAGIRVERQGGAQPMELSLPREGSVQAMKAFVPYAMVEGLGADVDEVEIIEVLPSFDGWAVDKLQVVSPRIGAYEWQRAPQSILVELTDPVVVTAPAAVTMTAWRPVLQEWKPFLRVLDLSGMTLDLLPAGASVEDFHWLEKAVLPAGLRVLPRDFFYGCVRLKSIVTGSTALEEIELNACGMCKTLGVFRFPPTIRKVENAFQGTSIPTIDLSGTVAERAAIGDMVLLAELNLPRRCVLERAGGVPSLRRVTFGASRNGGEFGWKPTEVRFESLAAETDFCPGLVEARVYAEVACELGRETIPFPPP